MDEILVRAESADQPRHWAKSAIRWVVALKNATLGIIGGAWMAYAFLVDPEYALAFPLRIGMLIGAVLFPFIAFSLLLRHWKRVLLWFPAVWMSGFISLVVLSTCGVLTDRTYALLEGYRASVSLIFAIEAAHRRGVVAESWDDLEAAGVINRDSFTDYYYDSDSFTWVPQFDGEGKFTGTIFITGDRKRNLPWGTTHITARGRPALNIYGYNPHLFIVPRTWLPEPARE